MNRRLLLSCIVFLILVSLAAVPVMAAIITCPSSCTCLLPAEAAKINAPGLCGGKQIVCGSDGKNEKYCYEKPVTTTTTVVPQIIVTGYHVFTTTPAKTTTTVTPTTVPAIVTGLHAVTTTPQTTAVPVMGTTKTAVQSVCRAGCSCLAADKADAAGYQRCSTSPGTCGTDPAGRQMFCYSTGPVGAISPPGELPPSMLVPAVISTTQTPAPAAVNTVSKRDIALAKLTGSTVPQSSTASQLVLCNGTLTNVLTDPANCGSCGAFCAEGLVCSVGQCILSTGPSAMQSLCIAFQMQCNGSCISYLHDDENCGGCGNRCGVFETCCNGRCTNTNSDPANCHDCGAACGENSGCSYGLCSCINNTILCGTRCIDYRNDRENCGGCNLRCREGEICCNSLCVDTSRDLYNCGTCNHYCEMPYTCADGRCIDINTNEEHCGTNGDRCGWRDEICCAGRCINWTSDNDNCGSCGNDCGFGVACCHGTCIPVSSLQQDSDNCGSCGHGCYGMEDSCCGGRCTYTGWDNNNCGRCGHECPWYSPYCVDGDCWTVGDMLLLLITG